MTDSTWKCDGWLPRAVLQLKENMTSFVYYFFLVAAAFFAEREREAAERLAADL